MNQFRPVMIPEPKHSAAVRTEASLRRARCHLRPADGRVFLDQILPLGNLESIRNPTQIDAATKPTHLTANTARTELIRHGSVGFKCKLDAATLAAPVQLHGHIVCWYLRTQTQQIRHKRCNIDIKLPRPPTTDN